MSTQQFDESKHRRTGDGKFTAKGYAEAADGTDADLGDTAATMQTAQSVTGLDEQPRQALSFITSCDDRPIGGVQVSDLARHMWPEDGVRTPRWAAAAMRAERLLQDMEDQGLIWQVSEREWIATPHGYEVDAQAS